MKLLDIVKSVGAGIIRNAVPGGGILIDVVNDVLPDDKKLPITATGDDVQRAITSLPAGQQVKIMSKEFDVDITRIQESNETLRTMLQAEANSQHTTRPAIAWWSFVVVAVISLTVSGFWAYGVYKTPDTDKLKTVVDGWPFIASLIGPFVGLLMGYMGVLMGESRNRLTAARGGSPAGIIGGIVDSIRRR